MYPPVDWVTPGLAVELVADLAGTRLLCRLQVDRNRMHWYDITINLILSVRYHTSGLFEAHFYLNFPTAMSFFFIDMGQNMPHHACSRPVVEQDTSHMSTFCREKKDWSRTTQTEKEKDVEKELCRRERGGRLSCCF